ncbi:MAG: hypothetical protein V4850_37320 [Myxococcota bacterium]
MRVLVAALLLALASPAHAKYPIRPATYADLLEGEKIAGFRYYFTTKGRYRVEGEFYELREVLSYEERYKAEERGLITGWEVDDANTFWRYEGIKGGDLRSIELLAAGHDDPVWGIRAEVRWPAGVSGLDAQLAHLGLRLTKVRGVGAAEGKYEGRFPGVVLVETDDPRILVGVAAIGSRIRRAPGGSHFYPAIVAVEAAAAAASVVPADATNLEVAWIVREVTEVKPRHLDLWEWDAFAASTRKRLAAGDAKAIDARIPVLAAAAVVQPDGAALADEVAAGLMKELAAAGAARAATSGPTATKWIAALERECFALATIASVRPPREQERAPVVAALGALADTLDTLASKDTVGGAATLRAAGVYARELGEVAASGGSRELAALPDGARRVAPLLDLTRDASEPVWTRADRLAASLATVVRGHAEDPRVAALAAPTFALLEAWAEALLERGMVGRALPVGLAVDHAVGRFHEHHKGFLGAMEDANATRWQREAVALFGRVVGAPPANAPSATAFVEFVRRSALLRPADDGPRVVLVDPGDLARVRERVGGPELAFERWKPKVNVREGVVGYAIAETRTKTVEHEVDNTVAYAAMDAELVQLERHLAWIEAERAKVFSDMPMAVRDDQVVLDRVTGMAIGPNTGSGERLNDKREELQKRLDSLETSRRASIEKYQQLTGTVLPETRKEQRTEVVDVVHNVIVWQGEVRIVHALRGGGASSLYEQVRRVPDVQVRFEPEKAGLIAREVEAMQKDEPTALVPLFRRWLDARLEIVLEERRVAYGWTAAELVAEREALVRMLATTK